jgi:hypothetical protein
MARRKENPVATAVQEMNRLLFGVRCPGLGLRLPVAEMLATCSASPASVAALGSLCQDHTQLRVVSVLVNVMHADMSLQVVGSRIAMLLVWAERTARSESVHCHSLWNRPSAYHMYPGL